MISLTDILKGTHSHHNKNRYKTKRAHAQQLLAVPIFEHCFPLFVVVFSHNKMINNFHTVFI